MKTIWIGADYPYCGQAWEVFGPTVYGRSNVRFIAMINADNIPDDAEIIYQDDECTIYRFVGVMFQVDKDGDITTTQEISGCRNV